ncbi:MBL fold metallo-hydrolase [Pannus brasiliensis CCIBt3594]|uniref:MBL fold metallo-hydrolase n=1 Tax=Pannus brasiliensis CCIBt3594 TaxID=1427578 RepID=A0AAW9QZ82_9CHRO
MATLKHRRPENVTGDFYVDSSCIDCDTCRWMAPSVFREEGEQSAVYHQPIDARERELALQALLSCPTGSIGTIEKPIDITKVQADFPLNIEDNVYDCGYHSESSFGATSYLIQHPSGNILIDSPRFTPPLVKRLEGMGGIRWMYLTHRDDVADHARFHEYFGCDRILHEDDITTDTRDVEIKLTGEEAIEFLPDARIIPVPGHSKGHTVLLYRDKFLFTGDDLAWSDDSGQIIAFRNYCWYSWSELVRSNRKLLNYRWEWLLPGHGRRFHASAERMREEFQKCLAWMETV